MCCEDEDSELEEGEIRETPKKSSSGGFFKTYFSGLTGNKVGRIAMFVSHPQLVGCISRGLGTCVTEIQATFDGEKCCFRNIR